MKSYKSYIIKEEGDCDDFDELFSQLNNMKELYQYDYSDNNFELNWLTNPFKPLTDKFLESKIKFHSDLKLFKYKPKIFNLSYVNDYYYLLKDLPAIFYNVKSLIIKESTLSLETLQHILDNLKYLEDLELINSNLLICTQNSNYCIDWPISLKKLNIGKNLVGYINDRVSPILSKSHHKLEIDYDGLKLSPINLPNLHSLEFKLSRNERYDNELWTLLKLNPQIRKLKISSGIFDPTFFDIIKAFPNLNHLDLAGFRYDMNEMEVINPPILNNIKYLCLCLSNNPTILPIIARQFPNITKLTILNYLLDFNQLTQFISKFHHLIDLKLRVHLRFSNPKELNFPSLNNLESLEFVLEDLVKFEEINWNVINCPKLKLVKFTKLEYFSDFCKPELSEDFLDNWELVYFPRKLTFYRINK